MELKAPAVRAGRTEHLQFVDHANTILDTPAFKSERASWDIILMVSDHDDKGRHEIIKGHSATDLIYDPEPEPGLPAVRICVRRWSDVIEENKRRLEFIADSLEHEPSNSEGLQYVREEYQDLLPAALQGKPEEDSQAAS